MQNSTSIHKWSELKGLAAVALDTGKKVGTIDDFYFEPATNVIYAFQVKTSLLSHGALLIKHIKSIGLDAATFDTESSLARADKGSHLATLPLASGLHQYRVLSEGGTVVGTIGNVLIDMSDTTNLLLAGFELSGNLRQKLTGKFDTIPSTRVISYGHDVIVIPNEVAETLS